MFCCCSVEGPKAPVPTPVNLVKYLEDPDYEHEDFTMSCAITLRARVSWGGAIVSVKVTCMYHYTTVTTFTIRVHLRGSG